MTRASDSLIGFPQDANAPGPPAVTVTEILIRLRLHRVRKGLLAGTHATATVAAEALKWGFWHFGDFSRAYKDCFGELPSETLRRATRADT